MTPSVRSLAGMWGCLLVSGFAAVSEPATRTPEYFVVVTGGELLEGAYADGHTHFLARTLRPLGLHCVGSLIVDDVRPDLLAALRFAAQRADFVLVTGGLGPTPNDITRETVSAFTGIALQESEAALAMLERRFGQPREQLRANLRRQCLVPERGGYLRNPVGTAVGLVFDGDRQAVVALPGPPRELQSMVLEELVPLVQRRFGLPPPGAALTLRFVGVGQSQIAQTLQDEIPVPEDVVVTSLFEGSRVDFTFTARRDTAAVRAQLERVETELRRRLEEFFYADDGSTLEQVVLRQVRARGVRLAVVEVATGGALGASLQGAPEAGSVLAGVFAAPRGESLAALWPDREERWRAAATPEARSRLLAEAAAEAARADWALVIGEPEGPDGTGSVGWGLRAGERWVSHRLALRGTGAADRAALVTPALDRLRRELRMNP